MKLFTSKIPDASNTEPNKFGNNLFTVILILIILFCGIAISILLSLRLKELEDKKLLRDFKNNADGRLYAFKSEIKLYLESLQSIKSLYDSSEFVSRKEFSTFTKSILTRHDNLVACEWIPKVKNRDRSIYEKKAEEKGFINFQFTEIGKGEKIVRAEDRNEYFPIYYIEPLRGNESALGLDLASNPDWKRRLEISCDSGKYIATPPLKLIQETSSRRVFIVGLPIYAGGSVAMEERKTALNGFVALIFDPGVILKNAVMNVSPSPSGIEMRLSDDTSMVSETIYKHQSRTGQPPLKEFENTNTFEVAGRVWRIRSYPTTKYIEDHRTYYSIMVLISGCILSILLSQYILSLKKRSFEIEKLVFERTAELEHTHSQLLHSEKLGAIGRLTASIAHEFNNPLYGITSVIKGVGRRARLSKTDSELVKMAEKECFRMKKLIQELQDFNRPTTGSFSQINLNQMISQLLLLGGKKLKENNIKLEKHFDKQMPTIHAVEDQIKQVLLNLITNAIDACEGGGNIKIITEVLGNTGVAIHVHDTGHGISSENINHIFEPFFTTKSKVKGTGLGLPVSYGIAKRHNGDLKVESTPGNTVFSLILPIKGGDSLNL